MAEAREDLAVLLPARDASRTLDAALASLEAQTLQPSRVVVVDDGSLDGTPSLLEAWRKRWSALDVVCSSGVGISRALNLGLERLLGAGVRWIARMDAGDVCHPERFETQLLEADRDPRCALIGAEVESRGPIGSLGMKRHVEWAGRLHSHEELAVGLWIDSPLPHPTWCVRRDAFDGIGPYDASGKLPEDYEWLHRFFAANTFRAVKPKGRKLLEWTDSPGRLTRTSPAYSEAAFNWKGRPRISRFRGPRAPELSAISVGYEHVCASAAGGATECWTDTETWDYGRGPVFRALYDMNPPWRLSGVSFLAAGYLSSCAIAGGELRCWGERQVPGPQSIDYSQIIVADGQHQARGAAPIPPPEEISSPSQIALGVDAVCGMGRDGLSCRGDEVPSGKFRFPAAVAAFSRTMCVLDEEQGIRCYRRGEPPARIDFRFSGLFQLPRELGVYSRYAYRGKRKLLEAIARKLDRLPPAKSREAVRGEDREAIAPYLLVSLALEPFLEGTSAEYFEKTIWPRYRERMALYRKLYGATRLADVPRTRATPRLAAEILALALDNPACPRTEAAARESREIREALGRFAAMPEPTLTRELSEKLRLAKALVEPGLADPRAHGTSLLAMSLAEYLTGDR